MYLIRQWTYPQPKYFLSVFFDLPFLFLALFLQEVVINFNILESDQNAINKVINFKIDYEFQLATDILALIYIIVVMLVKSHKIRTLLSRRQKLINKNCNYFDTCSWSPTGAWCGTHAAAAAGLAGTARGSRSCLCGSAPPSATEPGAAPRLWKHHVTTYMCTWALTRYRQYEMVTGIKSACR